MNCSREGCQGKLRVTNTYSVGSAKYQRAVCAACGRRHTLQTIILPETGRGAGARARAARAARQGKAE